MKREELKQLLMSVYKKDTVASILSGRRKPSFSKIMVFQKNNGIPAEAWEDIKAFIK